MAAANQRLSEDNGAARAARRQEKAAHESGPAVRKKSARQVNTYCAFVIQTGSKKNCICRTSDIRSFKKM
jgi:hypothetical protein